MGNQKRRTNKYFYLVCLPKHCYNDLTVFRSVQALRLSPYFAGKTKDIKEPIGCISIIKEPVESLGIIGAQLRAPRKPLGTILQWCSGVIKAYQTCKCLTRGIWLSWAIYEEIKLEETAMRIAWQRAKTSELLPVQMSFSWHSIRLSFPLPYSSESGPYNLPKNNLNTKI